MLKEKAKAPDIKLSSTNNVKFNLKNSSGNFVIIYFYPKDDTPGCTLETNDFNKLLPHFRKLNCEVYGISKDGLDSHNKFKKKYKIKFDLLSDQDKKVLKKYKVWRKKKIYGSRIYGGNQINFFN
ncbi:peroxiredoxin [Candidatus Pelagibacter sp.]|nr:peroxiredoxin [Candidatus Pelagibacter sp.]